MKTYKKLMEIFEKYSVGENDADFIIKALEQKDKEKRDLINSLVDPAVVYKDLEGKNSYGVVLGSEVKEWKSEQLKKLEE